MKKENNEEIYCPLTFQWMTQKGKVVLAMHPCLREKCGMWDKVNNRCGLTMLVIRR